MTKTECPTGDVAAFLATYCASILSAGSTCARLEKNVARMANAFGVDVDVAVMPRHIHMTLVDRSGGAPVTRVIGVRPLNVSFRIVAGLSSLSSDVAAGKLDFAEAPRRYTSVMSEGGKIDTMVILGASAANASFCRLFGGDVVAMLVVALATLAGVTLKQTLLAMHCDVRVAFMLSAFVSAVIGCTCILFGIGATPTVALGTSVLYLVPGIPFLNSFSDMLDRHYICAFVRFTDAAVLTGCLSAGLCAAMWAMGVGMF